MVCFSFTYFHYYVVNDFCSTLLILALPVFDTTVAVGFNLRFSLRLVREVECHVGRIGNVVQRFH